MSKMKAHHTYGDDEHNQGHMLAAIHPASAKSVGEVLTADEASDDGRSNWVWVRLPNGDLILGIFPMGDTYMACEEDAYYPKDQQSNPA